MDIGAAAGDESGDEETENWEGPTPRQRAWNHCIAFFATVLVIAGELSNEQNLIGLVVIGGGLAVLNVLITASNLEKASELEKELEEHTSSFEDVAFRENHSSHRRAQDMTSMDVDDLSFEDENYKSVDSIDLEEAERHMLLPRHPSRRHSYYRRWYDIDSGTEETRRTRYAKTNRRTRRETRYNEEVPLRGIKDFDRRDGSSRPQKVRKDRRDRSETVERHQERDKREVKRRDRKHKKKKRVRIARGSQEHIVIGVV